MHKANYKLTKCACFTTCAATAVSVVLSPMLFTTFHAKYGISYTLLGLLVVLNFATQLIFDLIYSFFSAKINLKRSVKLTSAVITLGLLIYLVAPVVSRENPYPILALGTVVFSAGSGLAEVLLSPLITSLPSEDTNRDLSFLHTCYAFGLVGVVAFSSVYIALFGGENWQVLTAVLALFPFIAFLMTVFSPIPELKTQDSVKSESGIKNKTAVLYIACIFFSGASELTMCQWCSGYLETFFSIPKTLCDLIGLGVFGVMLGIGRFLYTKFGKGIDNVLIFGTVGATLCYALVALVDNALVGLLACALTGFFVSMLWPGSLIAVTDRIPNGGVNLFALMAVGGDMGGTLFPQLVGIITDGVIANTELVEWGSRLGYTAEQFGLKAGMLFAILAPLFGAVCFLLAKKTKRQEPNERL